MTGEDVTVAIASCGRPEALARCLTGLKNGSLAPGEVIVVDQDPLPQTREMIAGQQLAGLTYLEQERWGVSASRNLALARATRSILAVTDDDCVPDSQWISAVVAAFSRPPEPQAVTGRILALGPPPSDGFSVSLRESVQAGDHAGPMPPWHVGSGGNFAARADALRNCGGWDERLGPGTPGRAAEDAELLYRLLRSGATVRYEPDAVVRHEWQARDRRLATRWSYGYGTGAVLGILARRGDGFSVRLLTDYVRLQVRGLLGAVRHLDHFRLQEHVRALVSLVPGAIYGLRSMPVRRY